MMDLTEISALVNPELEAMNQVIDQCLETEVTLIPTLTKHILNSGGKRIRPLLVLLSAKALGYTGLHHINLAASLELIHTATLLHDDVVDTSGLRRGKQTANIVWGNASSILVGDFLYSRAFQLIVNLNHPEILQVLADATNVIAQGEILQLLSCRNADTDEAQCLKIIRAKTGTLFSIATQQMAMLADCDHQQINALADYGMNLGIAFQLIDDALDYCADTQSIGKNFGDDLSEGKPTLPLVYALNRADNQQKKIIRTAIEQANQQNLASILETISTTQAIDYTYQLAHQHKERAIAQLEMVPDSIYRLALNELANFTLERRH